MYSSDRGGVTAIWRATFDGARLDQHSIVTDDGDNRYSGANWTPDGEWILARKRVLDTSTTGISEMWMSHRSGGQGIQLVETGGDVDGFSASTDDRFIYYAEAEQFEYNKNPHGRIRAIQRYDRVSGKSSTVSA